MISTSIFTGANLFIIIAISLIAAVVAILTTDIYQEVNKKKDSAEENK
ncbi:MAG: hypothetical protein U5K79_04745 [Cyclobacteriaceae bacterium]|nr:hypothetical protein [Cyclobacteriaceae bacterium]